MRDEAGKVADRRPMTAIYSGKCRSQHPISNFIHVTRPQAPNHNPDYQRVITANDNAFRKANGPFTDWFNNMNTQKFISVPFKDAMRPNTTAAGLASRK